MRLLRATLLASALALGLSPLGLGADKPQSASHCHGTAIEFVATPVEAARQAAEEKKLVLVLHVSGYFEDPGFT